MVIPHYLKYNLHFCYFLKKVFAQNKKVCYNIIVLEAILTSPLPYKRVSGLTTPFLDKESNSNT